MNIVTWRPGRTGKGWVFPDGTVRAWSVNAREEPHHADVEHPPGAVRFRISPDGEPEIQGEHAWLEEAVAAALAAAQNDERV